MTARALSRLVKVTSDTAVAEHEANVSVGFDGANVDVHVEHCVSSQREPHDDGAAQGQVAGPGRASGRRLSGGQGLGCVVH